MDISKLTDDELWERTAALARAERGTLADLVEYLAEVDKRGLYKERGFVSLFEYCVHGLRCSEAAAYRRIRAARAIRLFPPISVLLREGRLNLETVALLHPFLGEEDAASLIQQAAGLRTWQVQALLAGRQTEQPRRDVIRFCGPVRPTASQPSEDATLFPAPSADPLGPALLPKQNRDIRPEYPSASSAPAKHTVRVSFSADEDFYALMQRARALLRHKYPDGRLEGVLKDALAALLAKRDLGFELRPRQVARRG